MSIPTTMEDVQEEISKSRSEAKIKEAREAIQREAKAHQETMARENQKAVSELDKLMEQLSKPEQRAVRMHAYLAWMNADWRDHGQRQAGVDLIARSLATYMVTGEAK